MQKQRFSFKGRLKSFVFAFRGIVAFFRSEHNAWLHGFAAILVLILSFILRLSAKEMIAILIAIAMVWITEMFNTAIEKMMDHLSPQWHPEVKEIKDLAAGAVLIAAVVAFIIGLIIFIPKFV